MATNKVVYGNTTLIDLTSDTVTPSDVANGVTFHDRSGTAQTGSYVAPTITSIAPSDTSPASMVRGTAYEPTANGYAVENNPSSITPSNASPVRIFEDRLYRPSTDGYAIEGIDESVVPSDSYPQIIAQDEIVEFDSSGVVIKNVPTTLTPSDSSPDTITSGTIYRASANGKAVASITNVTPSNSSPVALASGDIDKMGGNGYAIASYSNVKPSSNIIPVAMGSGYFYKITDTVTNYSYRNKMPYINPAEVYTETFRNTTKTYWLKNSAGDYEGVGYPLNYWLITAAFKTNSTTDTRGGTWLVVGDLDDRVNKRTLVELQKDSSTTNLTVTLNQNWTTLRWYLEIQSTATAYNYDIRIIRLTDNTTGY